MDLNVYPGFDLINNALRGNPETVLFYILAALAIPLAYGVVFDRVIIRSGFLLIMVFGTISGIFFLLDAAFLALAQLLIYAVGITLVVVIALMLTNPRMETESRATIAGNRLPGVFMAILVFLTLYLSLRSENWVVSSQPPQAEPLRVIGYFLMSNYSLPFEFASILLLIALIGAIMLAKADSPPAQAISDKPAQPSDERTKDVVKV